MLMPIRVEMHKRQYNKVTRYLHLVLVYLVFLCHSYGSIYNNVIGLLVFIALFTSLFATPIATTKLIRALENSVLLNFSFYLVSPLPSTW